MIIAMILAGGVGSRVNADRPKQFIEVFDKPVLAYTIDIFEENEQIDAIEIVCHDNWIHYLEQMVRKYKYTKVKWITRGGSTFQKSVINGIQCLDKNINNNDYVLIHYGAAPFTSSYIVEDVIRVMKKRGNAFSATPCYQLMGTNDGEESKKWIDRDSCLQIASPYGFKFAYLKSVYERADKEGLLEKIEPHVTSLIYALEDVLYKAYGDQTNIKITTKADIELFKAYVLMKQKEKQERD
ncbi:2-C-methyl-D-erythritol 4-phosphate cytidylyltransferase [Kineothrix sp. MSJ-39]|uniref:IspD/TarI family cytidylyltransferase n=1 Tax=Kineothrix sp. MSJ-39 TaxID=2841533 RepID=UPI001C0FA8FC|nr:IspD/TarI family cytidylyltransferase [Kineothrix sp. MSJ-39]MBU5431053.1 2-C-methyl-D-erythritol 4-phosphate cytidylyltransferase [Kineothrix sp. MSJ-39]